MESRLADIERMELVRLSTGEDILESLTAFVAESGIEFGVILNGVGSASRYRVHVVETTRIPPGDVFFEDVGPYDILNINGFIIDGRVHAHITLSNTTGALGGHLEKGTQVLTFVAVTIAQVAQADIGGWDTYE